MKEWAVTVIEGIVMIGAVIASWIKLSQKMEDGLKELNDWRAFHMIEADKRDTEIVQLKIMSARQEESHKAIKERLDSILYYLERQYDRGKK